MKRTLDPTPMMVAESQKLVRRIEPILAGNHELVQGAALCDLLAMWLAGHFGGDAEQTTKYRERLLRHHIRSVRKLIPVNEQIILAQTREGAH